MATVSDILSEASTTWVREGNNRSKAAQRLTETLYHLGFENIEESPTYFEKPSADSVAYVFAHKKTDTKDGEKEVISVTIRSASYDSEWASNVRQRHENFVVLHKRLCAARKKRLSQCCDEPLC